ncbi:hypothetical protein PENSPDRAFT_749588, partial [Peniophora sp. CONT]
MADSSPNMSSKGKEKANDPKPRRRPGRVPVSCAECRRLKLKCDRKVPCETCSKRGCADICPNGSLATGKINNKYVLSNTTELHARIDRMTRRIRELEYGLGQLQSTVSSETHELLRDDHPLRDTSVAAAVAAASKSGGAPPELPIPGSASASSSSGASPPEGPASAFDSTDDEFIDSFGTLSIGANGETRFYGATARGEYLLQAGLEQVPADFWGSTRLNERILNIPFPEASPHQVTPEIREMVLGYVPPLDDTKSLVDRFLKHATCFPSSLTREQVSDDVIEVVYHSRTYKSAPPASHALSLLFAVLSIASLYEKKEGAECRAHDYFVLSRVALTFDTPVTTTTVMSVQAMCYMAQYLEMRDVGLLPNGCSKAWMYLGLAGQMAHSIGLHVKSTRFKLEKKEGEYRSRVFWHLFAVETWTSFTFGRPPSVNLNFVDCELPPDSDVFICALNGEPDMGFSKWSYTFCQLLYNVLETAFAAKPPPYSKILDLDRKIRDFYVPRYLRPDCDMPDKEGCYIVLKRWLALSHKEWGLLNIHRAYFAQALRERPLDPLKHKFGVSVMALYRSAYRIVEASRLAMELEPYIFCSSNMAPSKIFSAAIVMCLLVCSAPCSNLANPSLEVLEKALHVVERGAKHGNRSSEENIDAIRSLYQQAKQALEKHSTSTHEPAMSAEELDRLCGQTTVITPCGRKFSFSPPSTSPNAPDKETTFTQSPGNLDALFMMTSPTGERLSPSSAPVSAGSGPSPRRTPMSVDNLLNDYTNVVTSVQQAHAAGYQHPQYKPQQPQWADVAPVPQTSLYEVAGYQNFAPAQPDPTATVPLQDGFGAGMGWSEMPYILDSSWQDLAQQLGF